MGTLSTPERLRRLDTLHHDDERWHLVIRIASSSHFRRATRLRDFLIYVCEHSLRDEKEALSEQHIGHAVFERPSDYSPAEDNVVRAHARQLRLKLAEYFSVAGKDEPLLLEIPKGGYAPVFVKRLQSAPIPAPAVPRQAPQRTLSFIPFPLLATITALAVIAAVSLGMQNRELRKAAVSIREPLADSVAPPLSWILSDTQPATIVVADTSFGLVQDLERKTASLEDYLSPNFFASESRSASSSEARTFIQRLGTRQLTSYADLFLAQRILRIGGALPDRISVKPARELRIRDLTSGNFIFLGSSYSNPWVSLFSKRRNFPVTLDPVTREGQVGNKNPRGGESPAYVMRGEDGVSGPTYGVIAFLPADSQTGNVLIIEGINMEGTEAAGKYLTDPRNSEEMRKIASLSGSRAPKPYLEFLLETKVMAGATRDTRIIASREGN